MKKLLGFIQLTRPHNAVIASIAVIVGAVMGPDRVMVWSLVLWAALSAALLTAGGNTLNDVRDVEVDRINKPHRPLASGLINLRSATIWAFVLLAGGVASSMPLPPVCRWIAIGSAGMICLYDMWGSGQPLLGNLMVSFLTGLAFLFGSLAVGHGWWGMIPGVIAFFFSVGREIIKDLEDMDADRQGGLRTWPLVAGETSARRMARLVLVLLLLCLPLPTLLSWLGPGYLLIALTGVGVPVLMIILNLDRPREASVYGRLQIILKWDMLVGLLAVLIG